MEHILKICKKCRLEKPLALYSLDRSSRDGHQKWCKQCWKDHHPDKVKLTVGYIHVYTWNKLDNSNHGLVQENLTPEWFCQACTEVQTDVLPPYMFEYPEREYIRICSKCQYLRQIKDIDNFWDLIPLVRPFSDL